MKKFWDILLILCVAAYTFNSNIAIWLYPNAEKIYEKGITYEQYMSYLPDFAEYYNLRNQIYEVVLFSAFVLFFYRSRGIAKAIAMFAIFVSGASVFDKCILKIYDFLLTDYIVIAFGCAAAINIYFKENAKNSIRHKRSFD